MNKKGLLREMNIIAREEEYKPVVLAWCPNCHDWTKGKPRCKICGTKKQRY